MDTTARTITCMGGAVLLVLTKVPWTLQMQPITFQRIYDPTGEHTIVWWAPLPKYVLVFLVSWGKPVVQVTNSDL